jgi:protein-tyrosine-phosphatase
MAEAVFRQLVASADMSERFHITSAGVMAMEGAAPHPFTIDTCAAHGIEAAGTARQLLRRDLFESDHIILADSDNLRRLQQLMGPSAFGKLPDTRSTIRLLREVPTDPEESSLDLFDPVRGGPEQFEECFGVVERCCRALLKELS